MKPRTINRAEIKASSMFRSIGHDPVSWELELEFLNGSIYRYKKVSPDTYLEFARSESKGKFFGSKIRGKYESVVIFKPEREPGDDTERIEVDEDQEKPF